MPTAGGLRLGLVFRKRQCRSKRDNVLLVVDMLLHVRRYMREQSLSPSVERSERTGLGPRPGHAQGRFPAKHALEDDDNLVHLCWCMRVVV